MVREALRERFLEALAECGGSAGNGRLRVTAIERDNPSLKGVLPKDYARPGLGKQRLAQLINLVSDVGLGSPEDRATITRQTFEAVTLAMPPAAVLTTFERAVRPLFAKVKASVMESCTLASLRDLLLPKLISGEIRVSGAERDVGKVL
ncbi:MAG: hypothetical protein ACRDFS_03790 [Chloroflexota bacterium]